MVAFSEALASAAVHVNSRSSANQVNYTWCSLSVVQTRTFASIFRLRLGLQTRN